MKVRFTEAASNDYEDILKYLSGVDPNVAIQVENRVSELLTNFARWPKAARRVEQRPGIHVVPLIKYPYKLFYRVVGDTLEVVHLRHTARRPWEDETA